MKTRVYAIDLYELDTEIPVWDLDDDNFMDLAEQQGKVWTLQGFEKAFNNEQISDTWIIRIVTSN
jgi:hypothetical protein